MPQNNAPIPQRYDRGVPSFGRCEEHDKVRFKSRSDARKSARKIPGNKSSNGRLNTYPCDVDADVLWWHVGSIPPAVRGTWSRTDPGSLDPRKGRR